MAIEMPDQFNYTGPIAAELLGKTGFSYTENRAEVAKILIYKLSLIIQLLTRARFPGSKGAGQEQGPFQLERPSYCVGSEGVAGCGREECAVLHRVSKHSYLHSFEDGFSLIRHQKCLQESSLQLVLPSPEGRKPFKGDFYSQML